MENQPAGAQPEFNAPKSGAGIILIECGGWPQPGLPEPSREDCHGAISRIHN
jgi:hypothetical protein